MTKIKRLGSVLAASAVLTLIGCETMNTPGPMSSSQPVSSAGAYARSGVVHSIDRVQQGNSGIGGSGIGIGTIAGAVVGGVLGNQVGGGTGKTVATVAGAAGGAYAGHELEKRQQTPDGYKFTIRMDGGSYETLTQDTNPDIRVGDRVWVDNGVVRRR
jgi:outer membrane lipoprotein SlyB